MGHNQSKIVRTGTCETFYPIRHKGFKAAEYGLMGAA